MGWVFHEAQSDEIKRCSCSSSSQFGCWGEGSQLVQGSVSCSGPALRAWLSLYSLSCSSSEFLLQKTLGCSSVGREWLLWGLSAAGVIFIPGFYSTVSLLPTCARGKYWGFLSAFSCVCTLEELLRPTSPSPPGLCPAPRFPVMDRSVLSFADGEG